MESEKIFCIYKIINIINGKIYVGQTTQSLEERVRKHFSDSKNKIDNNKFHNAIRKYGNDNFKFEIIEIVDNKELLNERECYWINYLDTVKNGYNTLIGGVIGNSQPWLNKKHSLKTRHKMSESRKGYIMSEFSKSKLSNTRKLLGLGQKGGKEHHSNIEIIQLDKNTGDFIREFVSISEAEIYFSGKVTSNIQRVLNYKYRNKTAYGYKWITKNEYLTKKAQSFIWDKDLGLTDILHSVIK